LPQAATLSSTPTSADLQFAVVRLAADWRVYRNGQDAGRFDYQVDAVEAAVRLAEKARRAGLSAEVLVQDRYGQLERLDDQEP
jgi:hypothetical protein